jgi:hypothetical protein
MTGVIDMADRRIPVHVFTLLTLLPPTTVCVPGLTTSCRRRIGSLD